VARGPERAGPSGRSADEGRRYGLGAVPPAQVQSEVGAGADVKWNFEKFLVGRDGCVAQRFKAKTDPEDPGLVQAIVKALGGS
jgi:hypothetical protein